MSNQEKVAVKFVKHWRGYNPGEIAGFEPSEAQLLHDGGVAEKVGGGSTKKTRAGSTEVKGVPPAGPDTPADAGQAPASGGAAGDRP